MWYAKTTGGYTATSVEGTNNANMIASYLSSNGWSILAISALLGNGAGESGLNPWRWESDYIPTYSEFLNWTTQQASSHGYGLFGFTPANKYINSTNATTYANNGYSPNFSDLSGTANDGEAQTLYFMSTVQPNWTHNLFNYYDDDFTAIGVDISTFYYVTYSDFIQGLNNGVPMTINEAVGAFELCYEKPADYAAASSYQYRVQQGQYWYNYFTQNPPAPITSSQSRLPIWMYVF